MLNKQQLYKGISNAGCGAVGLEVFFQKTPRARQQTELQSPPQQTAPARVPRSRRLFRRALERYPHVAASDYGSGAQVGYLARVRR